jgi:hypothetical protein
LMGNNYKFWAACPVALGFEHQRHPVRYGKIWSGYFAADPAYLKIIKNIPF